MGASVGQRAPRPRSPDLGARRPRHRRNAGPSPLHPLPATVAAALGSLFLVIAILSLFLAPAEQSGPPPQSGEAQALADQQALLEQGGAPVSASEAEPSQPAIRFTLTVLEPSYAVQPGDTLEGIARRFNTTAEAIQSINNLSDRNVLRVGQKLYIP